MRNLTSLKRLVVSLGLILLLAGTAGADETVRIDGTTNVEDTQLRSSAPTGSYGGEVYVNVYTTTFHGLIRVKNVDSELGVGATITACACSVYAYIHYFNGDVSAYRVFKPWVEGTEVVTSDPPGATWDDWSNDDWEWATAGCNNADDGGSDNSGDGTGADRKATAEDTESCTEAAWYGWDISTDLAQGWYDGTINEEGIILIGDGDYGGVLYSTESAEAEKPFWTFTYTTDGEEPAGNPRRNREQRRRLKGETDEEMDFYARLDPADYRQ